MPRLVDIDNLTDSLVSDDCFESDVYDYCAGLSMFADMELTVRAKVMLHNKPEVKWFVFHIKYYSENISQKLQEAIDSINKQAYYIAHEKIKSFLSTWYREKIFLGRGEYILITDDVFIHSCMFHKL